MSSDEKKSVPIGSERAKIQLGGLVKKQSAAKPPAPEDVRRLAEVTGFTGNAVQSSPEQKAAVTENHSVVKPRRRRRPTGRTYPFNTKLKPETYNLICELSDEMSDEQGRPISMAEVLEQALALFVRQRQCTNK